MGALTAIGGTEKPGDIKFHAASSIPAGWIKANGAVVSRTAYSALFAVIGTTYGAGDGATTFGLPDLRGEFVRGFDDGRGVDSARVFGSAQTGDLQAHTHTVNTLQNGQAGPGTEANHVRAAAGGFATESAGGAETRPRNVAMLACIKY